MPQPNRKTSRHLQTGTEMTAPIEAGTWPYYQFGTGNRDDQHMAAILRQLAEAEDVLRQALVLCVEASRRALPVITIDAQAIPLTAEQDNPSAIDCMLGDVERIQLREVLKAVADRAIPPELLTQARDAFGRAIALRLMAALLYGVPDDYGIPSARLLADRIETRLPDDRGIDVIGDDLSRLPDLPSMVSEIQNQYRDPESS